MFYLCFISGTPKRRHAPTPITGMIKNEVTGDIEDHIHPPSRGPKDTEIPCSIVAVAVAVALIFSGT